MKIAVTSPNGKTISGHAGRCPGFLIYEIDDNADLHKSHLKLTKEQVFRKLAGQLTDYPEHPLQGIDLLVTQSIGEGLKSKLRLNDIEVLQTSENNPDDVINSLIQQ